MRAWLLSWWRIFRPVHQRIVGRLSKPNRPDGDGSMTTPLVLTGWSLYDLVTSAHQRILNAPRKKDVADREAMRLLEEAVLRLHGRTDIPKGTT